jgi:2-hydroxy-3-keto-5-methylthiopentenyl-1-phosphate phosphatase
MRLLALRSGPEIMQLLKTLEEESKAITEDIIGLAIYSGQSYDQMWNITHEERKIFLKVLKEKISLDRGIKPKETVTQELI